MSVVKDSLSARREHVWQEDARPPDTVVLPDGFVVTGDGLGTLQSVGEGAADVIFLDPPFNLGKAYGESGPSADRRDPAIYFDFMTSILTASSVALAPGGALYLYHVPSVAAALVQHMPAELGFRHWIAVSMKNGFARGSRLYPAHYALLYYTKGTPAHFCRPKLPPPVCRHCGKVLPDYGGYKQHMSAGVNLSDVWTDISPVRHKKHKTRDANELPLAIPRRVLQISGVRDGLVVDPFAGSGAMLVAARECGMRFIGGDREQSQVDGMIARLEGTPLLDVS